MATTIGVPMAAAHNPDDAHASSLTSSLCCTRQSVYRAVAGMARQRGRPPTLSPRRLSQPAYVVLEKVQKHAQ
jgi:hypothetical protein